MDRIIFALVLVLTLPIMSMAAVAHHWKVQGANIYCLMANHHMVLEYEPDIGYKIVFIKKGTYILASPKVHGGSVIVEVTVQTGPLEVIMPWAAKSDVILVSSEGKTRRFMVEK